MSTESETSLVPVSPTTRWTDARAAPPLLKGFSLTEIRMLLRAILPQPAFDAQAALALLAYRRRRKAAAYRSHRKRTIQRLIERMEHVSL